MNIAKIIRHRHKFQYYINDDLKTVSEDIHYKILFVDPNENAAFNEWVTNNKGSYEWNKEEQKVTEKSILPELPEFEGKDICWCDIFSFYMLLNKWELHSIIEPYKGEIYFKEK